MRHDIEAASREILDGPDRRRARGDARRQRGQPADGAADARPPLLHRPGRERPRPPGPDGGRPEAGRAGRLDQPDDVMFLRYNELRALIGSADAIAARDLVAARRREREAAGEGPAARLGRHGDAVAARLPVPRQLGLPGAVPPDSSPTTAARSRASAASPGIDRGHRPGRAHGRRVRRGPRRRHPRLPDDEPGLGRAVHQDRRPRHRHRRHDLASGRARRASSASRRSSARRWRPSASRPATGSGSTARPAGSRSSSRPAAVAADVADGARPRPRVTARRRPSAAPAVRGAVRRPGAAARSTSTARSRSSTSSTT